MVEKAKETPSYTKPMGGGDDARKVHPTKGEASYEKGYDRTHPHHKEGYSKVGSKGKQTGADERKRPQGDKANYETGYAREHSHKNEGYKNVGGCSKQGCTDERKEGKKKSPWRNA